jgi:hypothetical protein
MNPLSLQRPKLFNKELAPQNPLAEQNERAKKIAASCLFEQKDDFLMTVLTSNRVIRSTLSVVEGVIFRNIFINKIPLGQIQVKPHGHEVLEIDDRTVDGEFSEGLPSGIFNISFSNESGMKNYRGMVNSSLQMHGKNGLLVHEDGTIFEGEFRNDLFVGVFKITFTNDGFFKKYIGQVGEDGQLDGFGTLTLENQKVIVGNFKDDLTSGNIRMIDADLSEYKGALDSDFRKCGPGILIKANGTQYTGTFFEDEFCGHFHIINPQLTRFSGFLDPQGLKQGNFQIVKTISDELNGTSELHINGFFEDDLPAGEFVIKGRCFTYRGEVEVNLNPSGDGILIDGQGIQFDGYFQGGFPIKGKVSFSDSDGSEKSFEGEGEELLQAYYTMKQLKKIQLLKTTSQPIEVDTQA